ncbi:tetratricopeptide repeat protein [bacterium]|nr:tetratricopeptide repeat protein [bacterium]
MEKIGRNIIEAKQKIYGPFRLILPAAHIELDVSILQLMVFLNLIHVGKLDSGQVQKFYKYVEYMWEGDANFDDGLLRKALSLYKKAAKVALNPAQTITANLKIGRTLGRLGNTAEALVIFRKLLKNKWLNEYEKASTCTHYAWIEYRTGNLSNAEEFYYRALESARGNKYFKVLGEIYNGLGLIKKEYGHFHESIAFYQRALEYWSLIDYFYGIQAIYYNIANIYRIWGDHTSDKHPALKNSHYQNANEWTLRCISLCQKIGIAYETSLDHILLSELFLKAGDPDKAIEYAKIANEMAIAAGNKNDIGYSYKALSEAYAAKGETALAKAAFLKFRKHSA